ncbi:MAG: hypothetical protein ABIG90_01780 [bacterium]
MANNKQKIQIQFTSQIWQEGKSFVSYAPQLQVASCGKTQEQARTNLIEAIEGFIEVSRDMGTLNEILQEAGFAKMPAKHYWIAPEILAFERLSLTA